MKIIIEGLNKNIPAIEALLMPPRNIAVRHTAIEDIDIEFVCNGITVNDDRISIEFPNGDIADYEIENDDYMRIKII